MAPKTPTHNPTHSPPSLDAPRFESHGVNEFFLSRDHLVEVFVRVQVERGLNPRMPKIPCTVFGFSFALFTSQFDRL